MPNRISNTKSALVALSFLVLGCVSTSAEAQRLRFPSTVSSGPTTAYVPFKSGAVASAPAPYQPYQSITVNQPVVGQPTFGQPGVTLQGIQPAPAAPTFDPYASPGMQLTQPIATPAPTGFGAPALPSIAGQYHYTDPNCQPGVYQRFLQQVRVRNTWLGGSGGSTTEMDINTTEVDGTFMIPFFYLKDPFLLTPGFAVHFLGGPDGAAGSDMPARLYDAYLDLGWQPVITQWLRADLGIRTGIYSDFEKWDSDSVRILGRGLAVWSHSSTMEFRAGVVYLDRLGTKLLPAGGVVWMPGGPNGDMRWEFLFPNPKFSQRLTYFGTWDVWWYLAAEYGLGMWALQRGGTTDRVDINDLRAIVGLEWTTVSGVKGFVEGGYVFNRELDFASNVGDVDLDATFMLRGGIIF